MLTKQELQDAARKVVESEQVNHGRQGAKALRGYAVNRALAYLERDLADALQDAEIRYFEKKGEWLEQSDKGDRQRTVWAANILRDRLKQERLREARDRGQGQETRKAAIADRNREVLEGSRLMTQAAALPEPMAHAVQHHGHGGTCREAVALGVATSKRQYYKALDMGIKRLSI